MRSFIVIFHLLMVASVMSSCPKNKDLLQSVQGHLQAIHRNVANVDCCQDEPNQAVNCDSDWIKILETNDNGQAVSGSKEDLAQAVLSASKIRIKFGRYTTDTLEASVRDGEVCVQALFHISKQSWSSFQDDAYWWMVYVCTTGNVHMSRWFVGSHTRPSNSETRTNYNIAWFVRHLGSDQRPQTPAFCNAANGAPTCGKVGSLIMGINNGAEVRFVDPYQGHSSEITNIVYNGAGNLAAGSNIWSVSAMNVGNHKEFQTNAYWFFSILSSDGMRDMSRWSLGEHTDRGHNNDKIAMNWFLDPCWMLAYEHDAQGDQVSGALDLLRSAILLGKRVRLVRGNYALEADYIEVRNQHVTAQVLGHVSKADLQTFQNNAYWFWQLVSTTGKVETIRYNVGSNVNRGNTAHRESVKWFIDTRPWSHALSHSASGVVTRGSKTALIDDVQNGKMVRFVAQYSKTAKTSFSVFNADNIDISPDNANLGAQHIRSISISNDGASNVKFQSNPYWYFLIASTTGKIDASRWTVGSHQSRGHSSTTANIDWFTS